MQAQTISTAPVPPLQCGIHHAAATASGKEATWGEHAGVGKPHEYGGDVTRYPHLANLSPQQVRAIDLLSQGHSVNHVARALCVTRFTVTRWKNHHPAFIAQLNYTQQEILSNSSMLYRRLLKRSLHRLHRAIAKDDPHALRIAVALVNGSTGRKALAREIGPTDPISVVNTMVAQEQLTWVAPKEVYLEGCVHNEFVQRLARVDFNPQPADSAQPPQPAQPAQPETPQPKAAA